MQQLKRLIHEIHRRSLWQVLAIYLGASWVVFEIVQTLTEGIGLPKWFPAFALSLLLIGLPIVLATAFVQEGMAPSRSEAEAPASPVEEAAGTASVAGDDKNLRQLFTWRNAITGGVLAFALWGVVAAGWLLIGSETGTPAGAEAPAVGKSIAVLPFENLSPNEEDRYFADGIHDEILTHLARIGDLKVISRTSVMEYRNSPKNIREIASELDAATILEGTVRRAGDEVRITAQLIDAGSDRHLWAEAYERQLADIFAIQADVAERIARALAAEVTPKVRARIERRPTDDMEAYNAYLRGKDAGRGYAEQEIRLAIRMYERAVELDPRSVDALWNLAATVELLRDYEEALQVLDRAIALAPDRGGLLINKAYLLARGLGDLDAARETLEPAFELPRASLSAAYAGVRVRLYAREYSEALEILEAADEDVFQTQFHYVPKPLVRARILDFTDRPAPARAQYDSARVVLDRRLAEDPEDPRLHSALGLALAGLGQRAEAIQAAERAEELLPVEKEAWRGANT